MDTATFVANFIPMMGDPSDNSVQANAGELTSGQMEVAVVVAIMLLLAAMSIVSMMSRKSR